MLYTDKHLAYHIALGKSDGEIIDELDLSKSSRSNYRKRLRGIRSGERKIDKPPSPSKNDIKEQLCWTCHTKDCPWMEHQIPLTDWTAEKSKIYAGGYRISECPHYRRKR